MSIVVVKGGQPNVGGHLEVGINDHDEVVINHLMLLTDMDGRGYIIFSPAQARHLATLLLDKADQARTYSRAQRKNDMRKGVGRLVSVAEANQKKADTVLGQITAMDKLRAFLIAEIEHERQHLISIGGPSGMRNSQASAMGLARNSVREEILQTLDKLTKP